MNQVNKYKPIPLLLSVFYLTALGHRQPVSAQAAAALAPAAPATTATTPSADAAATTPATAAPSADAPASPQAAAPANKPTTGPAPQTPQLPDIICEVLEVEGTLSAKTPPAALSAGSTVKPDVVLTTAKASAARLDLLEAAQVELLAESEMTAGFRVEDSKVTPYIKLSTGRLYFELKKGYEFSMSGRFYIESTHGAKISGDRAYLKAGKDSLTVLSLGKALLVDAGGQKAQLEQGYMVTVATVGGKVSISNPEQLPWIAGALKKP